MQTALYVLLSLGLMMPTPILQAQPSVSDPEVQKGITLVQDGDYDAAIFTLDTAARRIAKDPAKTADLSKAYLYLGIAYFGKGHEAAAKAKFREAILQVQDVSLSADEYPPKIIDLFEAAREETREAPAPEVATAPSATAAPSPEKKKGGSKTPILLGVGGAAAAGIAVAAGGGGGDGGGDGSPDAQRRTETFSGMLDINEYCRNFNITVAASEGLSANATWTDDSVAFLIYLYTRTAWDGGGDAAAVSNRTTNTSAALDTPVSPQGYVVEVCHDDGPCLATHEESGSLCAAEFTLTVQHP